MSWTTWNSYQTPPGWKATRQRILDRDNYICHVCAQPGADQVDHLLNVAAGGTHHDTNLAAIHRHPCHTRKTRRENTRTTPTEQHPPEPHPGYLTSPQPSTNQGHTPPA